MCSSNCSEYHYLVDIVLRILQNHSVLNTVDPPSNEEDYLLLEPATNLKVNIIMYVTNNSLASYSYWIVQQFDSVTNETQLHKTLMSKTLTSKLLTRL